MTSSAKVADEINVYNFCNKYSTLDMAMTNTVLKNFETLKYDTTSLKYIVSKKPDSLQISQ